MRWPVLLVVLAACATEAPPTAELAAARAAVAQARPVAEYAPKELAAAHTKLMAAQDALARGENLQARRLAQQAEVDARLAWALSENERSRP
jgi:membrane peptidoglycan carboxypeptidase